MSMPASEQGNVSISLNLMGKHFPIWQLKINLYGPNKFSFQNLHLQNICKIKSKSSDPNRHLSCTYYNSIWNCSNWLICIIRYIWANCILCALHSNFTKGCTSPPLQFKEYELLSFNRSIRAVKNFHTVTVDIITSWHKMH